jgi:arginine deiminase
MSESQRTDEAAVEELAETLFQAYYAETYPGVPAEWSLMHNDTRAGWRTAATFVLAAEETRRAGR